MVPFATWRSSRCFADGTDAWPSINCNRWKTGGGAMNLVLILPSGDNRRTEVRQEFDRAILIQFFEAAAAECRKLDVKELAVILANDNIGLRPVSGIEELKPDVSLPLNSRVVKRQ